MNPKILKKGVSNLDSNELQHHGILGMKWGIRRYQNSDGTYTEEGKKRRGTSTHESSGGTTHSGSSGKIDGSSEDSEARSARRKEVAKKVAIGVGITAAAVGAAYLGYYAGTKVSAMNSANPEAAKELISSVSNAPVSTLAAQSVNSSNGRLTNPTADDIKNFTLKQDTPKAVSEVPKATQETPQVKVEQSKPVQEAPKAKQDNTSADYRNAHASKSASELSTQELAQTVARLNLEKKYKDLTTSNKVSGKKKVANIMRGVSGASLAMTPVMSIMSKGAPSAAANAFKAVGSIAGAVATIFDLMNNKG